MSSFPKEPYQKITSPYSYLHGLTGRVLCACSLQISRGRGQPHISQDVDGTSTVILVIHLLLKLNFGSQGSQLNCPELR